MLRNLHFNNQVWKYSVGTGFVVIKSPEGKRYNVSITSITGETWDAIERAKRKKYWCGVKPGQVKAYLSSID